MGRLLGGRRIRAYPALRLRSFSALQAPAAPTNPAATPDADSITITWTAVAGATSYNLYRGTSSGGQGSTPYQTGVTSPYDDTSVTAGTTYYYKVTAVGPGGESARSSEVSARTTLYIHDQFTDTDSTALPSHTIAPVNTPGNPWIGFSPIAVVDFIILSNKAAAQSTNTMGQKVDAGVSDCTVYASMKNGAVAAANASTLVGRASAGTGNVDRWLGQTYAAANEFYIHEVNGGAITTRATGSWTGDAAFHDCQLIFNGTSITFKVDALTAITYTSSFNQTATRHGMIGYTRTGTTDPDTFDDFKVISPPVTL